VIETVVKIKCCHNKVFEYTKALVTKFQGLICYM